MIDNYHKLDLLVLNSLRGYSIEEFNYSWKKVHSFKKGIITCKF